MINTVRTIAPKAVLRCRIWERQYSCGGSVCDPCAKKVDPCAKKVDPCAKKVDPCARCPDGCGLKMLEYEKQKKCEKEKKIWELCKSDDGCGKKDTCCPPKENTCCPPKVNTCCPPKEDKCVACPKKDDSCEKCKATECIGECDPRCNKYVETQTVCKPKKSCCEKPLEPPAVTLPPNCPRIMTCDPEFYALKKPKPSPREFVCGKKIICEDEWGLDKIVRNKYLTEPSVSVKGPNVKDPFANNILF